MTRRYFPRRFTYRWFATRGWALGGFVAFLVAAIWLRPVNLPINSWVLAIAFGNAALGMGMLSIVPESTAWRLWAVAGAVFAALTRSWAILNGDDPTSMSSKVAAAVVWLFVGYACWLLAMFTAKIPNRGRDLSKDQ